MRGIIYSSNPRMECLTPQFEGEEVRIRYQFHSEGLIEGDIQKASFFIVCNQGNITFLLLCPFQVVCGFILWKKIKNLDDFLQACEGKL